VAADGVHPFDTLAGGHVLEDEVRGDEREYRLHIAREERVAVATAELERRVRHRNRIGRRPTLAAGVGSRVLMGAFSDMDELVPMGTRDNWALLKRLDGRPSPRWPR
jgi:hypothetical protein